MRRVNAGPLLLVCLALAIACGGPDATGPTAQGAAAGSQPPVSVPVPPDPGPPPVAGVTITSLDVNPSVFIGGQNVQGTLTLSDAAPAEGTIVTLSSGNATIATVPPSITVAAGASTGRFQVQTQTVPTETSFDIAGTAGGATRAKTIRLMPPGGTLSALLTASDVIGAEQPIELTARLTAPAPAGGTRVTLTADAGVLSVPPVLTVPEGGTNATVTITARSVLSETPASISARTNGESRTAALRIWPVFIQIASTTGDPVARGRSFRVDASPSAIFGGEMWDGNGRLQVSANDPSDASKWWAVIMAAPPGRPLVPGTYRDARRIPPIGSGLPTLEVYGDGRGCNLSTGEFEVLESAFGPGFGGYSGSIQRFRATFKQTCTEAPGTQLTGEVRLATILMGCKKSRNC